MGSAASFEFASAPAGMIGDSAPMAGVYLLIARAGPSDAPVFLSGESGTGKDLAARAIHRAGSRADRPFLALNCAAIPADLLEAELFGHMKGAFTGAVADREGAALSASGGTLYLDELADMAPALQAKLLRFVQTGAVRRVGAAVEEPADVRIICATNREVEAEVAAGRLRADLFYRLHVLPIHLPPLRARGTDILRLAWHFLKIHAAAERRAFRTLTPQAESLLMAHDWPGNVRELDNLMRRVAVLHEGDTVTAQMLRAGFGRLAQHTDTGRASGSRIEPLAVTERRMIEAALAACRGNVALAAARLGVNPSTIYRKKQAWGDAGGRAGSG